MNHRIFERKLRSLDIQGACLSECRDKNYTPLVWHVGFAFASSWTRWWTKLVPRSAWTWMCCCACALGRLNLLLSFPMRYHASRYITVGDLDAFHFSVERSVKFWFWPQIRQDYPLNLSILISGGEENNCDILSSGERKGSSTTSNSILCKLSRTKFIGLVCYVVSLEKVMYCGDNPFHFSPAYVCG